MNPARVMGAVAVSGVLVFCMGRCSGIASVDVSTDVKREPVPVVTKTVTGDTKTVTKYKVPSSCLEAFENLDKVIAATSGLGEAGNPQLDIMSGAHEAMASKDFQQLVKLQERQNVLNNKTVGYVKDLEVDLLPYYYRYEKECKAAAK